jgi:hypothetical protein
VGSSGLRSREENDFLDISTAIRSIIIALKSIVGSVAQLWWISILRSLPRAINLSNLSLSSSAIPSSLFSLPQSSMYMKLRLFVRPIFVLSGFLNKTIDSSG